MRCDFDQIRLDKALIEEIQKPVKLAESLAFLYREKILGELPRISISQLLTLFSSFSQELCGHVHLANHPRLSCYFQSELGYKAILKDLDKT